MRLAFLGTPRAAVPTLEALVDAGHDVALVVTRPDRRRRRGGSLEPSPIKRCALEHGLPVTSRLADVLDAGVERGVVVAYGALVPAAVLAAVPMLNVHFSLLPRWRGAAPVERAILAGDERTGVTIITLDETLDTGPIHASAAVTIDDKDAATLTDELADLGARLLVGVLADPAALAHARPQVGEATYATKLSRAERALDPSTTAATAARVVRLGGAHLECDGRRLLIERVAPSTQALAAGTVALVEGRVLLGFADGALELIEVRPAGRRSMAAPAWWRGRRAGASTTWSSGAGDPL
ncbi:MAG TPA: methionyl-tRNA formyltransferase [Acidimicrobiales bacterium]|nr:methionyl-tRNA formyltransferase [Acidimicrobiales bacterium]